MHSTATVEVGADGVYLDIRKWYDILRFIKLAS